MDGYGPLFGHSCPDLGIENDCNNKRNSWGNFPSYYNREGGNKLQCNQDTWRMFSGATSGYRYKVV